MLNPASVASLGTGNDGVFWDIRCRVVNKMTTTAPAPMMSPNERRDRPSQRDLTAFVAGISEQGDAPPPSMAPAVPTGENAERIAGGRRVHESRG
jgi:hypothetical protein